MIAMKMLQQTARRHDLVLVRVRDPLEQAWPNIGLVNLEDAETGEPLLIDANRRFQQRYAEAVQAEQDHFARLSSRTDTIDVSTDGKHFDALLNFFRKRERRQRR